MTKQRASPRVNVTFFEIVQKRFIQFCYKFKNVTESVSSIVLSRFFVSFAAMAKEKKERPNFIL